MLVNTEVRAAVEAELTRKGLSKTELAQRLGVKPQALSRTLRHVEGERTLWPRILKELGLRLTVERETPSVELEEDGGGAKQE